jgi:hypothetical protein
MLTHEEFLEPHIKAAPQDVSGPIFERLLSEGYTEAKWRTNPGAMDAICISKDNETMSLADFISNTQYNAPIYSKTHVGCNCSIIVSGVDKPDVIVTALGEVQ